MIKRLNFGPKGARPTDLLRPSKYTDEETAKKRYEICLECPYFISATKQCKQCGCFMVAKTKLEKAECPIHKW